MNLFGRHRVIMVFCDLSMFDIKGTPYFVSQTYAFVGDDIVLHTMNAGGWRKSTILANRS